MLQGTEKIVGRPQYIEQLKKWQSQTDLIKIVTGVRRCGKPRIGNKISAEIFTIAGKVVFANILRI